MNNSLFTFLEYLFFPCLVRPHLQRHSPLLQNSSSRTLTISATATSSIQDQPLQPSIKKKFKGSVVPTLHCADTQEWRKRLISAAQHNIVISGNYSGGKALDELLDLIENRLNKVPKLQVLLITHPQFLTWNNKSVLSSLFIKYRTRFYCIESPDIFYQSKKTTNHSKFTIIDFGKFFIMGGSGIKDNFVLTGLDDLTVEQYLKSEEKQQENEADDLGINEFESIKQQLVTTGNFRDQDFVFQGIGAGKKVYRQALFLAYKWDRYIKDGKIGLIGGDWELDDSKFFRYPALTDTPCHRLPKIHEGECVLYRMLKRPIPNLETIDTSVAHFRNSIRKVRNVQMQFFFLGPETSFPNPFTAEMIARVKTAVTEIIIDHVYFQPPKKLLNELIAAVKRGVSLTIVTAGLTKNCPMGQKIFGPKNIAHYTQLIKSLTDDEERARVQIFEFEQNKKGLHKKVVIIDDSILTGSSNMDSKCLGRMEGDGDHDINVIATSQELVDQTKQIIQIDIQHSRRVNIAEIQTSLL